MTSLLIVFIKNPQKGRVKTRLAQSVGEERALEIYKKLLDHTRKAARDVAVNKQVWYSQFIPENDAWDKARFEKKLQKGGNLGERMQHAFREAFAEDYSKIVIIGSDCAEITAEVIGQAYRKLEDYDLVVGPSADGGYYLLGMNYFYPELFDDIAWSTSDVLSATLAKAEKLNLSLALLPKLNDVDNRKDWLAVKDKF